MAFVGGFETLAWLIVMAHARNMASGLWSMPDETLTLCSQPGGKGLLCFHLGWYHVTFSIDLADDSSQLSDVHTLWSLCVIPEKTFFIS